MKFTNKQKTILNLYALTIFIACFLYVPINYKYPNPEVVKNQQKTISELATLLKKNPNLAPEIISLYSKYITPILKEANKSVGDFKIHFGYYPIWSNASEVILNKITEDYNRQYGANIPRENIEIIKKITSSAKINSSIDFNKILIELIGLTIIAGILFIQAGEKDEK
jgi:hypothetical protein